MSEVISRKPYPEREDYTFPVDSEIQIWEALTLYPNREECDYFLKGLDNLYSVHPYAKAMSECADAAGSARAFLSSNLVTKTNYAFYRGVLLSMHVTLRPIQHTRNGTAILKNFTYSRDDLEDLKASIPDLMGADPEIYLDSLSDSGDSFQTAVGLFAERLYPVDMEDRADFLTGLCISGHVLSETLGQFDNPESK